MIDELKRELELRQKIQITDARRVRAAILLPIFIKNGRYHILFIQRTEKVREHKRQISFPGGAFEKDDHIILNTALREAEEEIGLARDKVQLLGGLDDIITSGTNYLISPVVGLIPYPYPFKVDQFETDEIIEVPLASLLESNCLKVDSTMVENNLVTNYFFHYGNRVIWGATARILKQFLEITSELGTKGISLEPE